MTWKGVKVESVNDFFHFGIISKWSSSSCMRMIEQRLGKEIWMKNDVCSMEDSCRSFWIYRMPNNFAHMCHAMRNQVPPPFLIVFQRTRASLNISNNYNWYFSLHIFSSEIHLQQPFLRSVWPLQHSNFYGSFMDFCPLDNFTSRYAWWSQHLMH